MKARSFLVVLIVLIGTARSGQSRLFATWSYQELQAKADLVVVAHPTEVANLNEKFDLPGISRMPSTNGDSKYHALGIETKFEVLTTFKGPELKLFVLHHYRTADNGPVINGPSLMEFDPKGCEKYLLFLRKRSDGQYEPVAGQVDLIVSIKKMGCL